MPHRDAGVRGRDHVHTFTGLHLGGQTNIDRRSCRYEAYVPDPLVGRRFVVDGDVAADVADAEHRAQAIQDDWRSRMRSLRRGSAAALLLRVLPGAPVVTVRSAAALVGRTYPAASNGVSQLVDAGVLRQVTIGRRNRAYEAPEIIDAFTALERQLASPEGETQTSKPARRVPQRC